MAHRSTGPQVQAFSPAASDILRLCPELNWEGAALDVDHSAEGGGRLLVTR